jgi:hypothetical protein
MAEGALRPALSSGQRFGEERGRWLVEAVVDEVGVEEVAGDGGGGLALRAGTNRSNAVRERRSKLIWPPQQRLAEDKNSGGARGRWSPTVHDHRPRCRAGVGAVTGVFG